MGPAKSLKNIVKTRTKTKDLWKKKYEDKWPPETEKAEAEEPFENLIINYFRPYAMKPDEYNRQTFQVDWQREEYIVYSKRWRRIKYRETNHQIVEVLFCEKDMLIGCSRPFTDEELRYFFDLNFDLSEKHKERHKQNIEEWF